MLTLFLSLSFCSSFFLFFSPLSYMLYVLFLCNFLFVAADPNLKQSVTCLHAHHFLYVRIWLRILGRHVRIYSMFSYSVCYLYFRELPLGYFSIKICVRKKYIKIPTDWTRGYELFLTC